jgi:phosphoribosyl-AMP cyclohydrolase
MASDISPAGSPGEFLDIVRFNSDGLVPVIAQQHDTGEVLMVAWANRQALEQTRTTGTATYYSRSRGVLWVKGESSGYTQRLIEMRLDCDGDTVFYAVDAPGPACHQLRRSCFSHRVDADGSVHTDQPKIA